MRRVLPILMFLTACSAHPASPPSSIEVRPDTIAFAALPVGASSIQNVLISVEGSSPARIDEASVPAPFTAEVVSHDVRVTFAPDHAGDFSAEILVRAGSATAVLHVRASAYDWVVSAQPDKLDFGTVLVGTEGERPLVLQNDMDVDTDLDLSTTDPAFTLSNPSVHLDAHSSAPLTVRFSPTGRGVVAGHIRLTCDGCGGRTVDVTGTGAIEDFTFEPSPLQFGGHPVGSTTCHDEIIRNSGDVPIRFNSINPDANFKASGVFDLSVGNLLDGQSQLAPGDSAVVTICFKPNAANKVYAGKINITTVTNKFGSLMVAGSGGGPGLATDPADVNLGVTPPGISTARDVLIENGGDAGSLVLQGVYFNTADSGLHLAVLDGSNGAGVDVGTTPLRVEVVMNGTIGFHTGTLVVKATDGEVLNVPVSGVVADGAPCDLQVSLDDGFLHPGQTYERPLRIRNNGTDDCNLWGFHTDPRVSTTTLLDAPPGLTSLSPGATLIVNVRFSTDGSTTAVQFWKLAAGDTAELVSVPIPVVAPEPDYAFDPNPVDFGTIQVGFLEHLQVSLTNHGDRPIRLGGNVPPSTNIFFSPDTPPEFTVTDVPTSWPYTLPAGGSLTITVAFQAQAPGHYQGELEFWLAPVPLIVPVRADVVDPPCSGDLCTDLVALCPQASTTFVGAGVDLSGKVFETHAGSAVSCTWSMVSAPAGSIARPLRVGDCEATLKPDMRGDYTAELAVKDDGGRTSSCRVDVHADSYDGLSVETTWDSPDDLDLHLFHALAGEPSTSRAWFDARYDCNYGNPHPHWDAISRDDDPELAADDQSGMGPEVIELPVPGSAETYGVGVHWFADTHGTAQETATTRILCSQKEVAVVQTVLTRPHMAGFVGSVTWNGDGTCEFTPSGATLIVVP